jgi:hypothetical protein
MKKRVTITIFKSLDEERKKSGAIPFIARDRACGAK